MSRLLWIAFDAAESGLGAGFAQALGVPYDVLCLAGDPRVDAGAEKVLQANVHGPADGLSKAIQGICGAYTHVASVSTMRSKDLLPRVAALTDAAMVTDAVAVHSLTRFDRPIVAGSLIATVEVDRTPIVLTVRPAGFAKPGPSANSSIVEAVSLTTESRVKQISVTARSGGRPDLTQAKIIVSGGRPLKDAETFEKIVGGLADQLGGAVGATRAAVDSGIAPNELQVGQTGKIVAPDLYIAAGISGSTQHMAGIKDSKVIVAINKDADAPIFEFADFGLVADLFDALPELTNAVRS